MPDTITPEQSVERCRELRTALLSAGDRLGELRKKPASDQSDDWKADVRSTTQEITVLDAELRAVERSYEPAQAPQVGPQAATRANVEAFDTRSMGARMIETEAYADWAKRGGAGAVQFDLAVPRAAREFRTLLGSSLTDTSSAGLNAPLMSPQINTASLDRIRLFIEDIVPVGQTTYNLVPYIRELNSRTNETGATTVAEGTSKPEVQMQFVRADAPVRKIAAWLPATTEILADAPTLMSYVDARLRYMLMLREEAQYLNGDGTGANILGIRQVTGLQLQTAVAGDNATTLAKAMAKIELVDGVPDGIAMNPTDYWTMVTRRTTGSGVYDSTGLPFGMGPNGAWGLPVVRTRQMEAGKALVGCYRLGAQIFDREDITVRIGEQHDVFFVQNKVAVLAESRSALAVYRPDFFVEATLA